MAAKNTIVKAAFELYSSHVCEKRSNAGDKVLIAIEIFLEWRELFKRNVPLSTIIDCQLKSLLLTVPQVSV